VWARIGASVACANRRERGVPRLEKRIATPGLPESGADGRRLRFLSRGCALSGDRRVPARHRRPHPRGYGLTETSTVTTVNRLERYKFGTVGKALPGTEIRSPRTAKSSFAGRTSSGIFNDPPHREAIEPTAGSTGGHRTLDEEGSCASPTGRRTSSSPRGKDMPPNWRICSERPVRQPGVRIRDRKKPDRLLTLAPERSSTGDPAGIPDRSVSRWRITQVLRLMQERVDEVNRGLASFEQVKKFALLERTSPGNRRVDAHAQGAPQGGGREYGGFSTFLREE